MKKKVGIMLLAIVVIILGAFAVLAATGVFSKQEVVTGPTGNIADIDWYDENGSEFTISTADQLFELAELSYFFDFKGQTIKLGADIVVNEGNADTWAKEAPERWWFPLDEFAGTFDGQGHTISGLYMNTTDGNTGLFACTTESAVVQNFKLVNSYFEVNGPQGGASSVSSRGAGTFKRIYSDATVISYGVHWGHTGGILGQSTGKTTVEECWFDGYIWTDARNSGGIVSTVTAGNATIAHCLNTGKVNSIYNERSARVGGICSTVDGDLSTLHIQDCLNTGLITSKNLYQVGSVLGLGGGGTETTMDTTYATSESYVVAIHTVFDEGKLNGGAVQFPETQLTGVSAYQWTNLDFENYWAIVEDGTPILKYFADEAPSLEGVAKLFSTDWYDADKTEYVLNTKEDFYGFAILSKTTDFKDKVVKLGADIIINEGKASSWAKKAPESVWNQVGTSSLAFAGTFDGQGHTISGIYNVGEQYVGLFARTDVKSVIKNFKLKNSYFESTVTDDANTGAFIGSISGRGGGTFDTIYSDAIVVGRSFGVGGIIGQVNALGAPNKITNCWFDGTVNLKTEFGICGGGIAGQVVLGDTTIEHCLNSGTITSEVEERSSARVGTILGALMNKDTKLTMKDNLGVGKIQTVNQTHVGTIIGVAYAGPIVKMENTYGSNATYNKAFGGMMAEITGGANLLDEVSLTGYAGYQWTNLDFKNYWAVNLKGTPVLKSFASSVPSLAGKNKLFDISWYKENAKSYTINSKEDLYGLAMLSQTTNFEGKTIQVAADITVNSGKASDWATKAPSLKWISIGNESVAFAGTFDGQGHTISGLYASGNQYVGMFARTTSIATIKNFKLENSYFESKVTEIDTAFIGSISGRGGGKFDTIYSDAIVVSSGSNVGGIVGQINDTTAKNTFSNCWFDGSVTLTTENGRYGGGITGFAVLGETVMSHCLFTGSIDSGITQKSACVGGLVGAVTNKDTKLTITDSLCNGTLTTANKFHIGSVVGVAYEGTILSVDEVYATTESYSKAIGQLPSAMTGGCTTYPEKKITGYGGYQYTYLNFDKFWAVDLSGTPILKSFASSVPSLAGVEKMFDTSWYKESAKEFTIKTRAELFGFALLSQTNDFAGKTVKLGADITINSGTAADWGGEAPEFAWSPIGNETVAFAGTFDGQMHKISGMYTDGSGYVGMFAKTTEDSTVKNLKLENSYFRSSGDFAGSISARGGGNFDTIYSNVIVVSEGSNVGGIMGQSNTGAAKITNCWFDGSVAVTTENGRYVGGIIGCVALGEMTIEHCLNTGAVSSGITTKSSRAAGICGTAMNDSKLTIKDCLNTGKLTVANKIHAGSVFGSGEAATKVTVENTYASSGSYDVTLGGAVNGSAVQVADNNLRGVGGYQWTELDFTNYWAARKDGAPALKSFVTDALDVTSVAKIDTSWYDEGKDEYTITTVEQMLGFTLLAQSKNFKDKTVKLGNDINMNEGWTASQAAPGNVWTPIGTASVYFAGTFDGQGHKLSGIYVNATGAGAGLFGYTTEDATVKNLVLANSYFSTTADFIGAVAGRGGGTFATIYVQSDVTVTSNKASVGGILGQSNQAANFSNCWVAGTIKGTGTGGCNIGGIVGSVVLGSTDVKYCLVSGTIGSERTSDALLGGLVGVVTNGGTTLTMGNSLNVATMTKKATQNVGSIVGGTKGGTITTIDRVYALNESHTTWCQGAYGTVNGSVTQIADRNAIVGSGAHTNTDLDFTGYWTAKTGTTPELTSFTSDVGNVALTVIKAYTGWYNATDKTFTLSDSAELLGFAKLVNEGNTFAGKTILLDKNIVINEGVSADWAATAPSMKWTPIGNATYAFEGTFDGQGHTISGLYANAAQYVGLFGRTTAGSKIQNVKLANCYFKSTNTSGAGAFIGSISGRGGGTFDTIYVNDDVLLSSGDLCSGGIIGQVNAGATITNCWFAGSITTTTNNGYNNGGIVGAAVIGNTTIKYCLFTGTITNGSNNTIQGASTGGICGALLNGGTTLTIENCLAAGTIYSTLKTNAGSIVGTTKGGTTITFSSTYASAGTYSQVKGGTYGTISGDFAKVQVADDNLKGESAKTNASGLDFTNYWTTIEGGTPVLKSFTPMTIVQQFNLTKMLLSYNLGKAL